MSTFQTSCGHQVIVKPVTKVGGAKEGKWIIRVQGPKVTGTSGVKTIYTEANQADVIRKVAKFLKISPAALNYQPAGAATSTAANVKHKQAASHKGKLVAITPPPRGPVPSHAPHDKLEHSPNNMASCRSCGTKIQKGTLRVGLFHYDARRPNKKHDFRYYHDQCYPHKEQLRLGCSVQDHLAKKQKNNIEQSQRLQERDGLWKMLQSLRTIFAKRLSVPPYCVYGNATINDICLKLPTTKAQLFSCHGIAEKKWQNFGESILMVVRTWPAVQRRGSTNRHHSNASLPMPGVVRSPHDVAAAPASYTTTDEEIHMGESLSCEEIVNRKFEHAKKTGYIISID